MESLRKKNYFPAKVSWRGLAVLGIVVSGWLGCSHPISEELRRSIDSSITFPQIVQSTEAYRNKPVMFGGEIAEVRNLPDRTEIEVIQKKLDRFGCPDHGDATGGRFIFVKNGFLDPEIFVKGRYITGAGKVDGNQAGKIGEQAYRFPVIEAQELHLWEPRARSPYYSNYYNGLYGGRFGYRGLFGFGHGFYGYPYY